MYENLSHFLLTQSLPKSSSLILNYMSVINTHKHYKIYIQYVRIVNLTKMYIAFPLNSYVQVHLILGIFLVKGGARHVKTMSFCPSLSDKPSFTGSN